MGDYSGGYDPPQIQGGGPATFPITDTSGPSSVTLAGDAGAETASLLLANATEVAGMNAALGATHGTSLFASNATVTASVNIDLTTPEIVTTFYDSDEGDTLSVTLGTTYEAKSLSDSGGESSVRLTSGSSRLQTLGVTGVVHSQVETSGTNITLESNDAGLYVRSAVSQSGVRDDTNSGSKPACSAGVRGNRWYTEGGAGVADIYEVCAKDSGDAYAWRNIIGPPPL